ncbi:BMP family lipoprotein [Arcanobacterium hippocoleae]|uniref:Basic membrane protein A n=1 Tax=Arcanobacterium hippocoleae TaxID=149017 RepID=A0ABU1SZV9_9ACTO|nr:BMP family ABC transporter substrate-binding protein [Arcanobacterium hippocoleae]MDR6938637.1 basic membrane protein A [Arcanobacterium hippocoleae]
MKKSNSLLAIAAAATLALTACGGGDANNAGKEGKSVDYKACIISDAGGWKDKSFNESAKNGLDKAIAELKIQHNTAESSADTDFEPNVQQMVQDGCNLLIGVGYKLAPAITKSAQDNTDLSYALIDSGFSGSDGKPVDVKNGRALLFNTQEAAFLGGYVAASVTKTGKVATFGGMPIPSVQIFMDGFADGVKAYNEAKGKNIELLGWDKEAQTGAFVNSFDDQALGKVQAQQFIDQGADIIMPVAGPVGLGAAAAAKAAGNVLLIGVDSDWYQANPDYKEIVLTSVMKGIDASVFDTIKSGVDGKFNNNAYVGTLENGGVKLAPFYDFDAQVSDEIKKDLEKLTEEIKTGKLKIESKHATEVK